MHQSKGKKNKIIIYLLFLFILSTTSAKFINDQKKLSLSISKINIKGLSEKKNLEISNNLNNFLYKSIFVISEDEIRKILEKEKMHISCLGSLTKKDTHGKVARAYDTSFICLVMYRFKQKIHDKSRCSIPMDLLIQKFN